MADAVREIVVQDPTDAVEIRRALRVRNADGTAPHVRCEGARFHVLSWSGAGRHCTHPDCVMNRPRPDDG